MLEDILSKLELIIGYIQRGVAISKHVLELIQLIYANLVTQRAKYGVNVETA